MAVGAPGPTIATVLHTARITTSIGALGQAQMASAQFDQVAKSTSISDRPTREPRIARIRDRWRLRIDVEQFLEPPYSQ